MLPHASQNQKRRATARSESIRLYNPSKPLPLNALYALAYILEAERDLIQFVATKVKLLNDCTDFSAMKLFQLVAGTSEQIGKPEILKYLQQNGFEPADQDAEALLRRLGANAEGLIDLVKFTNFSSPDHLRKYSIDSFEQLKPGASR